MQIITMDGWWLSIGELVNIRVDLFQIMILDILSQLAYPKNIHLNMQSIDLEAKKL